MKIEWSGTKRIWSAECGANEDNLLASRESERERDNCRTEWTNLYRWIYFLLLLDSLLLSAVRSVLDKAMGHKKNCFHPSILLSLNKINAAAAAFSVLITWKSYRTATLPTVTLGQLREHVAIYHPLNFK
jgi:hypothetical protein